MDNMFKANLKVIFDKEEKKRFFNLIKGCKLILDCYRIRKHKLSQRLNQSVYLKGSCLSLIPIFGDPCEQKCFSVIC